MATLSVLLVDDNPDDRLLTRILLNDVGSTTYEVTEASTYAAALDIMKLGSFDVCLIDYKLGERTGLDLIAEALACGCRAPTILLTGLGDRNTDEAAIRVGAGDYLVKGHVTPESLERSIRNTVERVRMLQTVRESQEQFRLLLDGLGDHAIFLLTPEGRVASWNSGAERMSGYTDAEIIGEHVSRFYTEEDRKREWPGNLLAIARVEGTARDEAWRVRKDGSRFWAEVTVTALLDDLGRVRGYAKVVRDVTIRRRAEEQQQTMVRERADRAEAEARVRTTRAVEHTRQIETELLAKRASVLAEVSGVLVQNFMNHRPVLGHVVQIIAHATDAACVIQLIAEADEDVGLAAQAIEHPDEPMRSAVTRVLTGRHTPVDNPWANLDAGFPDRGPLADFISAPMHARTEIIGVLSLARFGVEAPAFTESDRGFANDLAARVALAVENARLYQAAQAALNVRNKFLAIAAHELKTPLTTVQGYSQLLSQQLGESVTQDLAPMQRAVHMIEEHTRHLVRLVEQLLDITRLVGSEVQLAPRETDLVALVRTLITRFEAPNTLHQFHLHVSHQQIRAAVDPLRLEQVMTNLIDNAVRYSPDGGPIDITVDSCDDSCMLMVRDRGLGVPEKYRSGMFEQFHRAHALDHRSGIGLGLHISREIVALHRGRLTVDFPVDGGSLFTVHLPRTRDLHDAQEAA